MKEKKETKIQNKKKKRKRIKKERKTEQKAFKFLLATKHPNMQ